VPGNQRALAPLWNAGVLGFKCFLVDSGVAEFPPVGAAELHAALPELAALGAPLLVHAELPGPLAVAAAPADADPRRHATWLATRPAAAELAAIELLVDLARRHEARVHVVHLATASGVGPLRRAREAGVAISVETCPHYLTLFAEDVPVGATDHKCAPPLRDRGNAEGLWSALREGTIELVASDHSPCPPAMKLPAEGDFLRAWGGIASLELSLAATWTAAAGRGFALDDVARWMASAPAALAGITTRKGRIAAGLDADLVVFDPDVRWRVDPRRLRQRHPVTPYAGRELRGQVIATFLRGRRVYAREEGILGEPSGLALLRPDATLRSPAAR
jgi:allantoinase